MEHHGWRPARSWYYFQVTRAGVETVLYSFTGGADGRGPYAALVQGTDGNLYGTTVLGGDFDLGTVSS